jgi:hypothetical protein
MPKLGDEKRVYQSLHLPAANTLKLLDSDTYGSVVKVSENVRTSD